MKDVNKAVVLSAALCLLVNLFNGNSTRGAVVNALLFLGYLGIYYQINPSFPGRKLIPFLALMPIFSFQYKDSLVYLLETFILLIFYLMAKIKTLSFRFGLGVVLILICFYASFFSSGVVSWPVKVDRERLLYPQHLLQLEIERQQKESLYLPYPLRFIIFSDLTAYGYLFLANLFTFLSFENLYRSLLLVNVYFLIAGLLRIKEMKKSVVIPVFLCWAVSLTVAGLIKTPDTMSVLSVSRGAWLLAVLQGISSAGKTRRLYLPLWLLSLLLVLGLEV